MELHGSVLQENSKLESLNKMSTSSTSWVVIMRKKVQQKSFGIFFESFPIPGLSQSEIEV
jgi:hypothetical protein